ncbi:Tc toxin subunit A-related protein [Pseudomonas fluorescens]
MALNHIGDLQEKRRSALLEYCIGHASREKYSFVETPAGLFELLCMDPLETFAVKSSWVAEATSCAQQYIHRIYRNLERGYDKHQFPASDLSEWELCSNYSDWAAVQLIRLYPENYINPFVRQRKTSLFKALENDLNHTRLNDDSVLAALHNYLQRFEQTCDLDVLSCYMDGPTPDRADYYFVGRERVPPFQYFWRKAEIELTPTCVAVNPAAWGEWQAVEIQPAHRVLDIRPVFWNGRLCLVWAEWRDKVEGKTEDESIRESIPERLDVNLSFMKQNGQWSAPLSLYGAQAAEGDDQDFHLIASVWIDGMSPKGKLGVSIPVKDAEQASDASDVTRRIYDVLLRPDLTDAGGWLDSARERFKTPETVQHSFNYQVPMTSVEKPEGTMSDFLDLHAIAIREGEKDVLIVNGFCRPTALPPGVSEVFELKLLNGTVADPSLEETHSQAGGWTTASLRFERDKGSWPPDTTLALTAETTGYGGKEFKLQIGNLTNFTPPKLVKNITNAAQFLSYELPEPYLNYSRLNSQFGPELVLRSNRSVEAVLDWDTQFLPEPPPTGAQIHEPNGAFDGANGLFYWELFFHLPHLVYTRMRDEERFVEAQKWLHFVFDPQAIADTARAVPKVSYWRCRPLANEAGNPGCEALAPADPDAIGYSTPKHFKILMFCDYVKNLMIWGDWYYRQLTRDSLVAARLCYVQAEFLMGPAPLARAVNRWQTATVGSLVDASRRRPALEAFEQTHVFSLADVPAGSDIAASLGLLSSGPFRIPIDSSLVDLFAAPGRRLHNLRNNLTLDGKPLDIPLFSPPTDPNELLRFLASGGVGGPRPMGGRLVVGAFRWRAVHEIALRAVQVLQDFGTQVLNLLERRDRAEQEELQQTHLVELGNYAQTVQEQSIAQLEAGVTALEQSRVVALQRADAYAQRYDENVSAVEYQVMASLKGSKTLALTAKVLKPTGAVIAALPKIFGMSNGGMKPENAIDAVCFGLEIASSMLQIDADDQATTEGYRRRRNEWGLQRDQALAEVDALNAQIEAQRHAVSAARSNLAQTLRANAQALTVYSYLKNRAGNAELFGWMLGQLKALHYQAYDAVISLCLSAQASLNAETGDYDTQIPLPQVWLDQRHGLTAGEHLRAHLLRMEREYLQRYERRPELVKTISLRELFNDEFDPQPGVDSWETALGLLQRDGTLEFQLTQLLFDRDHPGLFCRQIQSVEIDLPVLTGPFEDVRAVLLQIESKTATRATTQSVQYLHNPGKVAPSDVLINLRSGQQIVLSAGIADNGLTAMKPDDGLLNPFEYTGAVSKWQLSFPWHGKRPQADMLRSMTNVIVRVRYSAKIGETTFASKVKDLVNEAETAWRNRQVKGAGNHE